MEQESTLNLSQGTEESSDLSKCPVHSICIQFNKQEHSHLSLEMPSQQQH